IEPLERFHRRRRGPEAQEGEIDHRSAAGHDGHAQCMGKQEHRERPERVGFTNEYAEGQRLEPGKEVRHLCSLGRSCRRTVRSITYPRTPTTAVTPDTTSVMVTTNGI